ncbi:MAG: sulfotransferase [Bacteroidota bacterium]
MNYKKNKEPVILVLGMHRTGTSLVAQMVHRWGAYMGDDLMPANEYNQEGYWEYNPLVNLNDKMLAFTGNTWYAPPLNFKLNLLLNTFGQEARKLVDEMDANQTVWCWKDPRMAVLLPFWKEIFTGRNIAFIVTSRNPLSVAKSLSKRDDIPSNVSLAMWEFYTRCIMNRLEKEDNTLFVEYEKMLLHPEKTSRNLHSFLTQFSGQQKELYVPEKMSEVIKPGLHHSKASGDLYLDNAQQVLFSFFEKNKPLTAYSENKNRLMYCYEILNVYNKSGVYEEKHLNMQLFCSSKQNKLEEHRSILKKFKPGLDKIEFKFKNPKKTRSLRFDPLDDWVALLFNKLELFTNDELVGTIKKFDSNAFKEINGNLFFLTHDPQLIFDCSKFAGKEITKVVIYIDYALTGVGCKKFFADNPHLFFDDIFEDANENHYSINNFVKLKSEIEKKQQNILSQKTATMQLTRQIKNTEEKIEKEKKNFSGQIKILEKRFEKEKTYLNRQIQKISEEYKKEKKDFNSRIQKMGKEHEKEKKQWEYYIHKANHDISMLYEKERNKLIAAYKKRILICYFNYLIRFCLKPKKYYRFWREKFIIKKSGLFDYNFYLANNKDLYHTTVDLQEHYILHGSKEGRNPNPLFDTTYYLQSNPDVKNAGINPLVHFIKYGWKEGRNPNLFFDVNYFLENNHKIGTNKFDAIKSFVYKGWENNQYFQHEVNREVLVKKRIIDNSAKFSDFIEEMNCKYGLQNEFKVKNEKITKNHRGTLACNLIEKGIFNPLYYLIRNQDLIAKNLNLYEHFFKHGIIENRIAFSDWTIKKYINKLTDRNKNEKYDISDSFNLFLKYKSIGVISHSRSNDFFLEIRDYFVTVFRNVGIESYALTENDILENNIEHLFIIAPHEFFLFNDISENLNSILNKSSVYITEQPQSKYYYQNLDKTFEVVNVFDMNYSSMLFYESIIEKEAHYLPLGFDSSISFFENKQALKKNIKTLGISNEVFTYNKTIHEPISKRPVDIFFLGAFSNDNNDKRRMKFFARNSLNLSKYNNLFYFVDGNQPLKLNMPTSLSLNQSVAVSQRSKILLNIHRENFPYFEWHRIVWLGIAQKCLVITENVLEIPHFKNGEHYLSGALDDIPGIISQILDSESGMETAQKIVDNAYQLFIENFDYSNLIKSFQDELGNRRC